MGTQQILMIILSVIVVGTAIAVGIQMFDTQLDNQTRQALAAELIQQAAQAQAYYRTPLMMGGGGNGWMPTSTTDSTPTRSDKITVESVSQYIQRNAVAGVYRNLHGEFTLTLVPVAGGTGVAYDAVCTITGVSDVNTLIKARAVFNLAASGGQVQVTQSASDGTFTP